MIHSISSDAAALVARCALLFTCAVFFLLGYTPTGGETALALAIFSGAAILFYLQRRFLKNIGFFVILHLVPAVAAVYLSPIVFRVPMVAGVVGLLADSFYCRLRNNGSGEYGMHWAPAGLLVLLYIVGASYGMQYFCRICFVGEVCFLAGWFLYTGLSRTHQFLEDSKDMANVPAVNIRRQAGGILTVCTFAVLGIMMLAPKTFLMQLLEWGKQGILYIISKLLGLVHVPKPEEVKEVEQVDMGQVFRGGLFEKEDTRSALWDILDNIVFVIVYAALFCAAVALIVYVVRKMRQLFSEQLEAETDVTERIVPEKRQSIFVRNRRGVKKDKMDGSPENVKIRKLYKRFMEAKAGAYLTPATTPKELERAVSAEEEIRKLYEKARYSGNDCTKDEAERMKQQVKKK
ncbi:MAG: DUF4129 domain-containing protein [Clostridia bacterium]|nr:DUF4129 domain-containing protein [Clostridia bacterium]